MSADARIIMTGIVSDLRVAHLKATALLELKAFVLDAGAAGGARTSLRAAGTRMASLSPDGAAGQRVLTGERPLTWWRPQAQEVWSAIAWTMQQVDGAMPTPSRFWDEVVTPSASTLAAGVKSSASTLAELVPWVAAAAIALAVAYLVFSFRGLRR